MSCPVNKYQQWIGDYVDAGNPIIGRCREVCEKMLESFPELELRGGYSHTKAGSEIHFWLRAPDGSTVDPTESQYGCLWPENYEDAGTTDVTVLLERFLFTVN